MRWPLVLIAGCGDLVGFGGPVPPLATIHVAATGDFESVRVPGATGEDLQIALVWGTQWLQEPLCFLPPESPEVATVVAAGCRDPLAFTPVRVAAGVAIAPNEPTDLTLFELPSAEVMFGGVTARVAFGSLVVFDDRDHSGTLELARARRLPVGGFDEEAGEHTTSNDIIYGASFVAMDEPDQRLAFREGAFVETGFYPRHGCAPPLPAFSILGAGGFSLADALAATLAGTLPSEMPETCTAVTPDAVTVAIPLRPSGEVREVGCEQRRLDSSVRYRQPPSDSLDFTEHAFACAGIPQLGDEAPSDLVQLVVASSPTDTCRGLTHYTLIGCDEGKLVCDAPEWDFRANPPAWWPCPVSR